MIKRLISRDKKYHIDINIKESPNIPNYIDIIEEPILKLFLTSTSFFPIISDAGNKDHIDLIKKNFLKINIHHEGRFTPYVDVKTGQIYFHINFMKYLWTTIYCLFSFSHPIIELEVKEKWDGNALKLNNISEIFFMTE